MGDKTHLAGALAIAVALGFGCTAEAKPKSPPAHTDCLVTDVTVNGGGASACQGWISGNLNGASTAMKNGSADALNLLVPASSYSGSTLTWLEDISVGGPTVDFATALFGDTIVSFHVGAAKGAGGVGYESTAFYEFDAGNIVGGLNTFTFNLPGLSNARLYSTGSYVPPSPPVTSVPEPATWALMLLGTLGAGAGLRFRRRTTSAALAGA